MNKQTFITILTKDLQRNQEEYNEHLAIRESLKACEGKKVTSRFQNYLPEGYKYQVNYQEDILVYSPSEKKHSLCRKHDKDEFSLAKFDENNSPYCAGSIDRIDKLNAIINHEEKQEEYLEAYTLFEKIVKLIESTDQYDNFSYNNPSHWQILSSILDKTNFDESLKRGITHLF